MKFTQNEPIPIRNMKETHEIVKSATLIGFLNQLAVLNDLTEKSTLDININEMYAKL